MKSRKSSLTWAQVVADATPPQKKKNPIPNYRILKRGEPMVPPSTIECKPSVHHKEEEQVVERVEVPQVIQDPVDQPTEPPIVLPQPKRKHHKYEKKSFKKTIFAVLDLEMTGLSTSNNRILEVAVLLTDADLQDLGVYHSVCHIPESELNTLLETWSQKMHAHTGLLQEVAESTKTVEQIDQELFQFLNYACGENMESVLFFPAGISINNDLKFVERDLPFFYKLLHYQTIELSGWRKLVSLWAPRYKYAPRRFSPRHRALPDVYSALNLLMYYKSTLFQDPNRPDTRKVLDPYLQQKHIHFLMDDKVHSSAAWSVPQTAPSENQNYYMEETSSHTSISFMPYYFVDPNLPYYVDGNNNSYFPGHWYAPS